MADDTFGERLAILESLLPEKINNAYDRMDLKFDGIERARQIQFDEWMRRLGELNGEAGRLREMQVRYVTRELHDGKVGEIEKAIRGLENFQSNMTGRMAMVGGGIGLISGILAAIVTHFLGK
jgi:acyl-CoA reductase-like NAD-dependent aldehyde dehydrogenase